MYIENHPSRDIIATYSSLLSGKKIILGITGSVACQKSPEVARLLMRHGAEIYPVMSDAACKLIHPDLMEWATGHKPITALTGKIEHIHLAGHVPSSADVYLIAPSTANTVSKIAHGIDDTPITTVATTAIGKGMPIMIVPAMHVSMYQHKGVIHNIEQLKEWGIKVIMPDLSEGKAKIPETNEIFRSLRALLTSYDNLRKRKILITAGRTVEYLDPIRVLTNNSTGKMGIALCEKAAEADMDVTLVYGKGAVVPPKGVRTICVNTSEEMKNAVHNELRSSHYDICISAAAVGDWKPEKTKKMKTSTADTPYQDIRIVPTEKIVDTVKAISPDTYLVAFKALYNTESPEDLNARGLARLRKAQADAIAVNDVSTPEAGFESDTNEIVFITRDGESVHLSKQNKSIIAEQIIELLNSQL